MHLLDHFVIFRNHMRAEMKTLNEQTPPNMMICLTCLMREVAPEAKREAMTEFLVHSNMHELLYQNTPVGKTCNRCGGMLPLGRKMIAEL